MDKQLVYMYVIADRSKKDTIIAELSAGGTALIDFVYGEGYHERNLFNLLGFSDKKGKIIISGLVSYEKGSALIEILNEKYSFKKRDSGVAFTIPVEKIVY